MLYEKKLIKVVIASSDVALAKKTKEAVEDHPVFSVVSVTANGKIALEDIKSYRPQIILVTIELSELDGFGVVELMRQIDQEYQPYVIFVANHISGFVYTKAASLDIAYLFTKPVDFATLMKRFLELSDKVISKEQISSRGVTPANLINGAGLEKRNRAAYYLNSLKIYPNLTGYYYLRGAICMVVDDHRLINSMTTKIYPRLGEEYECTPQSVERSMRHAIEVGFSRADVSRIEELFGYSVDDRKGKPSNSEFIALIAERIRNELIFTE